MSNVKIKPSKFKTHILYKSLNNLLYATSLQKDMEQCRLIITGLDPSLHFGEWTCTLEAWNTKAEAKVVVKQVSVGLTFPPRH